MILILIHNIETADALIKSGYCLAHNLKKEFGILCYVDTLEQKKTTENILLKYLASKCFVNAKIYVFTKTIYQIVDDCEMLEASLLMIQLGRKQKVSLTKHLKACHSLRIPYLFFKDGFAEINFDKVLVPVGFLVEEYEKTQFASAFGRFCGSAITMLVANDYGSKAISTAEKMKGLFDKFNLSYKIEKARRDSYKLDKEAIQKAMVENYGVVFVSASRDYGLDDLLFGAKEFHLIKKASVPLLLINPRGDLYTLCD